MESDGLEREALGAPGILVEERAQVDVAEGRMVRLQGPPRGLSRNSAPFMSLGTLANQLPQRPFVSRPTSM